MLPVSVRGVADGTFYGLCNRMLRAHHKLAGLRSRSRSWMHAETSSRPSKRAPVQAVQRGRGRFPQKQLAYFITGCKEGLRPRATWRCTTPTHAQEGGAHQLTGRCQREGVVDFRRLMLRSLRAAA